jgi:hypothetical protein
MSNLTQQIAGAYNLSELIKTDCCIDCGSNEKLRELIPHAEDVGGIKSFTQIMFGVSKNDTIMDIKSSVYCTFAPTAFSPANPIPLTSINIDL